MNSLSGKLVLMHLVAKRNGDLKKHFQKWNAFSFELLLYECCNFVRIYYYFDGVILLVFATIKKINKRNFRIGW